MNVEHCDCLSCFCGSKSHEQDGERLIRARLFARSASSDPAMAFLPISTRIAGPPSRESAAALLPDETRMTLSIRSRNARQRRAHSISAANAQPPDQILVTTLIGMGEIIEQLPPLRYQFEQTTPGMVVLDVTLEMLGQIVDALR